MKYDEYKKDLTPEQVSKIDRKLEQFKNIEGCSEEVANLRKALYGYTLQFAEILAEKNRLKAQLKRANEEKTFYFNTLIGIYKTLTNNQNFEKIKNHYELSVLGGRKGELLKQQIELEKQLEELKRP